MADKAPSDLLTLKKSRASLTGALTKLSDRLKAIRSDEAAAIAAISTVDVNQILTSLQRTENKIQLSMEHGQTFCPTDDGYEDFQEREESILEVFDTNITAIRGQARKLLNLSNILTGLSDLTCDISAIESSLTEDSNSVHSSSLHSLESSFSKLRMDWREYNLPKDHHLKGELDAVSKTLMNLTAKVVNAEHSAMLTSSTSAIPVSSSRVERDRTKLPAIALPTFKGDILQ